MAQYYYSEVNETVDKVGITNMSMIIKFCTKGIVQAWCTFNVKLLPKPVIESDKNFATTFSHFINRTDICPTLQVQRGIWHTSILVLPIYSHHRHVHWLAIWGQIIAGMLYFETRHSRQMEHTNKFYSYYEADLCMPLPGTKLTSISNCRWYLNVHVYLLWIFKGMRLVFRFYHFSPFKTC